MSDRRILLVGLGNPGPRHAGNRHNVGFMAVDAIHARHGFAPWSKKFQALVAEGKLAGERVTLIKPQTFMNLSGQSVGEAMRFYKLGPDAVTVLYDEIDLAPGKLRVKTGGGAGGHNGIRSLDQHIGNAYRRVRIGVGHPGVKALVHNHVLGDFAKADAEWLDPLLGAVAGNAGLLATGDEAGFMNKIALAVQGAAALPGPATEKPKAQSHIRQAREAKPALPETGPMAAMLRKLLGKD